MVYGCTYNLFLTVLPRLGIEVSFVDTSDLDKVKPAFKTNTKMVFLETPSNPTMTGDIAEIAAMARERGVLSVVDNTFATAYFQKPLQVGAYVSLRSCTKYIGGHADLLGGVIVGTRDFIKSLAPIVQYTGGIMGPHEAGLCIRGLKTLHLRMVKHAENAMKVAEFLEAHQKIK